MKEPKMKMIRSTVYLIITLFLFKGCVSPVEYDPVQPTDILVVEGFIDNDFGPHEIQVTLLSTFAGILDGGITQLVEADVKIIDDLGNHTLLASETLFIDDLFNASETGGCAPAIASKEITTNYFTPATFRGIVGRSYMIEISLPTKVYRSTMELLRDPVEMDSLFVEYAAYPGENALQDLTGVEVYASFNDPSGEPNFYYWELDGVYKIETPDTGDGLICCLYDPRDEGAEGMSCWVTEDNIGDSFAVGNDFLADGDNMISNVGFVEDDGRRFTSLEVPPAKQYHVTVKQYTISEDAYEFYSNVDVLGLINGEIFDPPPVSVSSNIYNLDDPNETVVGYFGAFGKSEKGVFVDRSILEDIKDDNVCGDCRFFFSGDVEIPEVYQ